MPSIFPKFFVDDGNGAPPPVTQGGGVNAQPVGPTTTGSGRKADQSVPAPQTQVPLVAQHPAGPIAAPRSNSWTDQNQDSVHAPSGKITAWQTGPQFPPALDAAALAAEFAKLAQVSSFIQVVREKLFPKNWERRCGAVSAGGPSTGTSGAATVEPARCLLDGVHNPTATPTTVTLSELDGDPQAKLSLNIGANGTQTFPTGVLFNRGINMLGNSAGVNLTFWGRTLD